MVDDPPIHAIFLAEIAEALERLNGRLARVCVSQRHGILSVTANSQVNIGPIVQVEFCLDGDVLSLVSFRDLREHAVLDLSRPGADPIAWAINSIKLLLGLHRTRIKHVDCTSLESHKNYVDLWDTTGCLETV